MSGFSAFSARSYRFIALDVETANSDCASICQIGLAGVGFDGSIATWVCYVDPRDYFSSFNTRLHGISAETVAGAATFAPLLHRLSPLLSQVTLVQHSNFDRGAIHAACRSNRIDAPDWSWIDSVRVARAAWPEFKGAGGHGLGHLKTQLNLQFNHHDAGEDARAAAMVVLKAEALTGRSFTELAAPASRKKTGAALQS
ncbi:exonuclease domain-containing protein [Falsigemmobacter faecalis]|uniref:Exonuclease n=1 Tax=Falsigemmobacter faecalis TaxID=2488730 RepID=A0A3P3DKB8_9RHOB|nr:exonuclease domain-containing protein [Falsigemmobacter faecalis]RRH74709.1 exonuclease [Falsigemmobacter faecalis]